jgi:hypothetical protein
MRNALVFAALATGLAAGPAQGGEKDQDQGDYARAEIRGRLELRKAHPNDKDPRVFVTVKGFAPHFAVDNTWELTFPGGKDLRDQARALDGKMVVATGVPGLTYDFPMGTGMGFSGFPYTPPPPPRPRMALHVTAIKAAEPPK